ncbi:unnamed protein product, partial [marine sediment metagenome]
DSRAACPNSGNSSRNSTPWWLKLYNIGIRK